MSDAAHVRTRFSSGDVQVVLIIIIINRLLLLLLFLETDGDGDRVEERCREMEEKKKVTTSFTRAIIGRLSVETGSDTCGFLGNVTGLLVL